MKTLITTLACALALSFALPAEAQMTNLAKCKVYNAKINLNEPKCLELGNLLFHKDKDPNWAKCEI